MGLDANISLLVATLDLKLVQLLRGAIRTADLNSRGGSLCCSGGGAFGPAWRIDARTHFHPTPFYEPRLRYHPSPQFDPRPIIRPAVRMESVMPLSCDRGPLPPIVEACKPACESPLPPPWRILAWETPAPPRPLIKVMVRRPDIVRKGSMIDCFM